jgi:hypothetical protein
LGFGAWGYGQGGEGGDEVAAVHGWNLTPGWDGWGRRECLGFCGGDRKAVSLSLDTPDGYRGSKTCRLPGDPYPTL